VDIQAETAIELLIGMKSNYDGTVLWFDKSGFTSAEYCQSQSVFLRFIKICLQAFDECRVESRLDFISLAQISPLCNA